MSTQALKAALLDMVIIAEAVIVRFKVNCFGETLANAKAALAALDAAQAQPEQPVVQEPVGEVVIFGGDCKEVSWAKGKLPPVGTKLYAAPVPPASKPAKTEQPSIPDTPTVRFMIAEAEQPGLSDAVWPETLTPELDEALGMMNFNTGPIAHLFRAVGADIPTKCEREQAFVLHWLAGLALKHGADWRKHAVAKIGELRAAIANGATNAQTVKDSIFSEGIQDQRLPALRDIEGNAQ